MPIRTTLISLLLILTGHVVSGQVLLRGHRVAVDNPIVTVTLTFNSPPSSTSTGFADLKFNKQGAFHFECDDNSKGMRDVLAYWNGGRASDSLTYPGLSFSDGCGNPVKFRAALAVNSRGGFYNNDTGAPLVTNFSWAESANLVRLNWAIENHGYYHEPVGRYSFRYDAGWNVRMNQQNVYNQLRAQGVEYPMRTLVVPTNYKNHFRAADSLGYLGGTSTNTLDGYTLRPSPGGSLAVLETMPPGFVTFNRWFSDSWTAADVAVQKTQFTNLVNSSTGTAHRLWRLGTHGPQNSANFLDFSQYIAANHQDKIWITTMHEHLEYNEVKRLTTKSEVLTGNTLTITLNLGRIPSQNRFRDMSLLVSGGTITGVTVAGADSFSYNPATGLVNIFKKKTTGFPAPSTN